jgi:hypothetical protein
MSVTMYSQLRNRFEKVNICFFLHNYTHTHTRTHTHTHSLSHSLTHTHTQMKREIDKEEFLIKILEQNTNKIRNIFSALRDDQ